MNRRLFGSASLVAALIGLPSLALAQEAGASNGDEIIVTARKRAESILKVPVVQSVLTAETLDRQQVSTIFDIAAQTPGITLGTGAGENGTQISLRGVGAAVTDPGVDQSVSLNIDGLQVSQGSAYSIGTFDMAQVEVLRGPQALFFGKASSGGVISIRTADPGDQVEAIGRIGYEAEAREWRGEAILSGPVTDTFGLRLSTMYSDSDGFFKNRAVALSATGAVQPARRFGATEAIYVRGTALFKPTDSFNARLKLNYVRNRETGGTPLQLASCPDGIRPYAGVTQSFFSPSEDCKLDRTVNIVYMNPQFFGTLPNKGVPFTNTSQRLGTLELNYDIGSLTLTSVTGYFRIDVDAMYNGTLTGGSAPTLAADKNFTRKEFTQELRLNSDLEGPLNFTFGAFYQDGKLLQRNSVPGNSFFGMPAFLARGTHDVDIDTISLFGQARYELTSNFELSGGARWTDERRRDTTSTLVAGTTVFPTVPKLSSRNWSPELTLTYTPHDDLTLFGSLKQAYKSGSYNITLAVTPGADNSFGDEKVQGGEIGLKSRLADRQLNVNLAGYYYKYTGLQTGSIVTQTGIPIYRIQNAGAAKVYGVDFDLSYVPRGLPGLSLRAAVNWNHARFSDFQNAQCWGGQTIAEGCDLALNSSTDRFTAQNLTGSSLPRAPDWQANAGFTYELPVSGGVDLSFGGNGQYTSSYNALLGRRSDFRQRGHVKLNANATVKDTDEKWEVALIGNNILNTLRAGYCSSINFAGAQTFSGIVTGAQGKGVAGSDELNCVVEQGRQVWLRLTLRPFGRN